MKGQHRLDCKCRWDGSEVVEMCGAHWGYVHEHKSILPTECNCKWDGDRVLSLCKAHHEYVQKEYVQVTGTLIQIDNDGKMVDYERIPDQNRTITQADIRRVVDTLQTDIEDKLSLGNPFNTIARVAVNCVVIALRKELL